MRNVPSLRNQSAPLIFVSIVALAALVTASTAPAQQQTDAQQGCITAVNAATSAVAKAQGKNNTACLKAVTLDLNPASLESCLSADLSGVVSKARARLGTIVASKCASAPDFGLTTADAASTSATSQDLALFRDVFGYDPTPAAILGASDPATARCQRAIQKAYEKVVQAELKEFGICKKAGLRSGAIASQASLAACLTAMTADETNRIAKAVGRVDQAFYHDCVAERVDIPAAFPGRCEVFFADCIRMRSVCRSCLLLNEADGTGASCDMVDNGVADDSCNDCGNGVLDLGEECDDANRRDGDCCSSDCKLEASGQACLDDGKVCTTDTCDGGGACIHATLPSCPFHEHVVASNLVVVYTKSFVPNAPGGFDAQDPRDKRSIETVVRVDPTIDFDFSGAPPGTFFYPYMYSIRWIGGVEAASAGSYAFEVTTGRDGIGRLFIDGTLVAEKTAFDTVPVTASVDLTAGRHEIRFDFVNYFYALGVRLRWQPPGDGSLSTISPGSLYPVVDGATSGGLTGTYYATPLFMDKVEQIRKYYHDLRAWVWTNTDLQLDPKFDIRVIDAPLNLSRYDVGFMGPSFQDLEGRSVWGDVIALRLDPHDFASVAAWSPPLLAPDSQGTQGLREGFDAAGATGGASAGGPTYTSIQTNIVPAEFTEFGLRVYNWFADAPISEFDIYPFNHSFPDFVETAPAGFGDSLFLPYHAIGYRRPDLQDWKLLLARPGGFALEVTPDSDGDGIPDGGTDVPINEADFSSNQSSADTDLDGLSDFAELTRGFNRPTDPVQADTDGDGIPDADDKHPRFPIQETILKLSPVRDGSIAPSEYGDPLITVSDPGRPSDFTATLWVTWNPDGLNVAVKVVDESISPPDGSTPEFFVYGGDHVRVRLDMTNDGYINNPSSVYSDNLEIGIAPLGANASPVRFAALHHTDRDGYVVDYDMVPGSSIPAYYQLTSDGYVVEFLVPANPPIGFTPATCTPIAMHVEIYDRDEHQDAEQLRYQMFREGAVAVPQYFDYQCDLSSGDATGGFGAFASLVLADSLDQNCNHAPSVETISDQVVTLGGKPLRSIIRASDHDRDRLTLNATIDGGQPLSAINATFEDRGINLGILRWNPFGVGTHLVTVTATDPAGATGQSSFSLTAQPPN